MCHTATAEPTFLRVKHNRRAALFRVWQHYICSAYFYTPLTACAKLGVNMDSPAWRNRIGDHISFIFH
jgi:spore germination cell wall hydrolase CwlJ-like protein